MTAAWFNHISPLICLAALGFLALGAGCAGLPRQGEAEGFQPGQIIKAASGRVLDQAEMDRELARRRVVLVGETHDHPDHHRIQLDILRRLAGGQKVVVGVEWLDHGLQPACDHLSKGEIDVDQFAQEVNWKESWGYPLKLYRPILEEVRAKGHSLVALNAPLKVVRKVARQGLASLSPEERARLAPALDLDDPAYEKSLTGQFKAHGMAGPELAKNFFAAQVARDDTMAHNLYLALTPWPDGGKKAVVFSGSGHLSFGRGLPPRIERRLPGAEVLTVMPLSAAMARGLVAMGEHAPPADWLAVSTPTPPRPPRLGVLLKPHEQGLEIVRVFPGTPAQKAGLKPGDILTAVDGSPLKTPKDIHTAIKAAPYDEHHYSLRRGPEVLEITITLPRPATGRESGG